MRISIDEIESLIANGADVNQKDEFGSTALSMAISQHRIDVVRVLLKHGADLKLQNSGSGYTPLHTAIEHKQFEIAEILLNADSQAMELQDKHGNQPLWTAVFSARGNFQFVKRLIELGADANHLNKSKMTPLLLAKRFNDPKLIEILENGTGKK